MSPCHLRPCRHLTMGYTTNFSGHIRLSRKLTIAEAKTLLELEDMDREEAKKTTGVDSYLQWVPSETLDAIVWNEGEKFYDYVPLLEWLCGWLKERGIGACGSIHWSGEDVEDVGEIIVIDNVVTAHKKPSIRVARHQPMTLDKLQKIALEQLAAA